MELRVKRLVITLMIIIAGLQHIQEFLQNSARNVSINNYYVSSVTCAHIYIYTYMYTFLSIWNIIMNYRIIIELDDTNDYAKLYTRNSVRKVDHRKEVSKYPRVDFLTQIARFAIIIQTRRDCRSVIIKLSVRWCDHHARSRDIYIALNLHDASRTQLTNATIGCRRFKNLRLSLRHRFRIIDTSFWPNISMVLANGLPTRRRIVPP